ncbi:hypothetical protein [Uliginosibacterium aquaticum]|uniref:Uncharacterized protein n=1 Tax=Uliginosibacterium aquaticum TaxID=2731212 RepID=A0ABX2IGH1_9RHOO|nr:hypothetical protein [Uliginosibacterium aquaticum]NSL55829.1 hypothetical protein [Uliginosibacterium aquaticum]
MKTLFNLFASLLLCLGSAHALAAPTVNFSFAGCTDGMNRPVASKADPALPQLVDVLLVEGNRVITYNPSLMPQLLPETRAFFYAHACAITRLGQPIDRERSTEQVKRADCWAFDTLQRSGLLKGNAGVEAIQSDLELSPEVWPLVPGPARSLELAGCSGAQPAKAKAKTSGNALKLDAPNATPQWNNCTLACGNKLYSCGRAANCQSAFEQCTASCKE